jgi:hypothetical protein
MVPLILCGLQRWLRRRKPHLHEWRRTYDPITF